MGAGVGAGVGVGVGTLDAGGGGTEPMPPPLPPQADRPKAATTAQPALPMNRLAMPIPTQRIEKQCFLAVQLKQRSFHFAERELVLGRPERAA